MKTLNQILEGTVVSADFKMSKSGRKYRAHRREMGGSNTMANEDLQQVNELDKSTLVSYIKKANASTADTGMNLGHKAGRREGGSELVNKLKNRLTGVNRAADKLSMGEGTMRGGKYVDDAPRPGTNEVPSPDEGYRPPAKKPIKKPSQMNTTKASDTADMEENYNPYVSIIGEEETKEKDKSKEKPEIKKQGNEVPPPLRDTSVGAKMNNALKKIIDIFAGGRGMDEETGHNIVAVIDGVRSDRKYNDADHAHNSLSKLVAYQKAKKAELYVDGKKTKHYELNKKYSDFEPKKLSEQYIQQVDEIALKPEHKAAIKRLRPSGSHSKTSFKLDSGKTYYATREGDDVHLVTHETGAGTSKKTTMKYSRFDEEVEQVDEISKGSIEKYMNKSVTDFGHQNLMSRVGKGSDKEAADRKAMNRSKGIERAVLKTTKKSMGEDTDLDEARGRPAGAATLAKRAAASAKPKEDDGEDYGPDSGMEADQHIHVQLKKASDSDQKPFEVSFKNGKKHTVSQKVANDILSATDRLKPEHRKNVHDEIHQSYDNLMSVHRLIARK